MIRKMLAGTTSQMLPIFAFDTSSTTGAGLGSLVFNSAGLAAKYRRAGSNSWTTISLVTATVGTFTSSGFIADGGGVTGGYEVGIPDAAIAAGVPWVVLQYYGATNMLPVLLLIELDAVNYQDAVHFGLSALPNTAVTTNASLLTSGTGTDQVSVTTGRVDVGKVLGTTSTGAAGYVGVDWGQVTNKTTTNALTGTTIATTQQVDVNTIKTQTVTCAAGVTVNVNVGTTQPLNFTGTAASALVKSDTVDIAGSAVATGSAQIGVNLVNVAGSAVSTSTAQIGVNVVNVKGSASAGAAGYVGIDWSAINAPTTTVSLSGTTVGTVTTVTNQLTAAAIATGVWQDATAGDFTTASSIGKSLYTSGAVPGAAGGLFIAGSNAATTANITGNITGNLSGSVGSVTGAVGSVAGNVTGSVGSVTGLTNATVATAVWTDTTAGDFATASSPGKILVTQLGGAFTNTSSSVYSTASLANAPTGGGTAPTVSQIATAVWQDTTAGDFTVASSIGKSLYTSGVVPGASGGLFIAGTNAATTITTALTTAFAGNLTGSVASVTAPVTLTSAYDAAKTAAQAGDSMGLTNAGVDSIFKRDWTAITGEAARSMLNALRFLRNKFSISGTTLTVTKEDDTTTAWTATVTTDAAAEPITGSDPS